MDPDCMPPAVSMDERLRLMLAKPQRRQRGQVPMEQVQRALQFQRAYVPSAIDYEIHTVSDCSESLARLRSEKREARELREMAWEDHVATTLRDDAVRVSTATAKKLSQQTAMLLQLKSDKDKWNMAVDLKLLEYLTSTLSTAEPQLRHDYLCSRNGFGQTPLHRAVKAKDARLVHLLLDLGADLMDRDDAARSVFHVAAATGQTDLLALLVAKAKTGEAQRAVLVQVDTAGLSPLHVACLHGHHEILRTIVASLDIVQLWAVLNLPTKKDGATPLHLAAQHGHEECLRLLLATKGIRPELRNARGSNALHLVLEQTFRIVALVKVFIDAADGSDIWGETLDSVDDHSGLNGLHVAILKNYRDVATALVGTKRVALNTSTREGGWSALHLAVMTEEMGIVQVLLEAGAIVDSVDSDTQTPLLQACLGGQLEIVRVLLLAGANPAHQNRQGHSPLHYLSAFCRDRALLTDVIAKGADVNAKSLKLNTPMHFAAMNGNEIATQVLLEHGASASAINEDKRSVVYLAKKWRHRAVEDLVKPPEEKTSLDGAGARTMSGEGGLHTRTPQFGTSGVRRAAPFASGNTNHHGVGGSHSSRTRTPVTTRSEDSDAESMYSFDDEEILEPSTPWPIALRTASPGNNSTQRVPVRSFGELRRRFMTAPEIPETTERAPLKPVVLAHHKERHAAELQAARELLDAPPSISNAQLTKFTRRLLTGPVHFPWEMTVPTLDAAIASTSDSGLQRKLKPSIRTNIGLLRDHLTHAQHLSWPRYANQRVFRKDDQLPG